MTPQQRYLAIPGMMKAHSLQCRIGALIRGDVKRPRLRKYLGCTAAELLAHLEAQFCEGMSWKNYGRGKGKWQVDHIRPKIYFCLSRPAEFKRCFHYTNLRPLWASENAAYERSAATLAKLRRHFRVDGEKARQAGLTFRCVEKRARRGWPEDRWYEPVSRRGPQG